MPTCFTPPTIMTFKDGYKNRRINFTLLYGRPAP
jgi:hypothetical protein